MKNYLKASDEYGEYLVNRSNRVDVDFTFIVGAYNAEGSIRNSILSLLNQSYDSFNIIVVDDGSSDSTFEVLDFLCSRYDTLTIIRQSNLGLTKSLNRAIWESTGRYIVRHDADDFSYINRLEIVKKFIEPSDDFIMSYSEVHTSEGECRTEPRPLYFCNGFVNPNSLMYGNPFVHGTYVFKSEFIKSTLYDPKFRLSQDYELLLRAVRMGKKIKVIPTETYKFIKSENSVSRKKAGQQIKLAIEALRINGFSSSKLIASKGPVIQKMLMILRELDLRYCK